MNLSISFCSEADNIGDPEINESDQTKLQHQFSMNKSNTNSSNKGFSSLSSFQKHTIGGTPYESVKGEFVCNTINDTIKSSIGGDTLNFSRSSEKRDKENIGNNYNKSRFVGSTFIKPHREEIKTENKPKAK